jgi:hypothetical protein
VRRSPTTCSLDAQARDGIIPVTYEDDVHPYSDLLLGGSMPLS